MKRITVELLRQHHACQTQINKFVKLFPNGATPTRELCTKHAHNFNFAWARRLLSPPAREAYDKATTAARTAYYVATTAAREAHDKATTAAWEAYDKATTAAWYDAWAMEE